MTDLRHRPGFAPHAVAAAALAVSLSCAGGADHAAGRDAGAPPASAPGAARDAAGAATTPSSDGAPPAPADVAATPQDASASGTSADAAAGGPDTRNAAVDAAKRTGPAPAFFGASGAGAATPGGRGGAICEVTTLADAGPGSLRSCVERTGPRIVVFHTGGTIALKSTLNIRQGFITIAGQTASGGGILLDGRQVCADPFRVSASDVVIRYLRVRVDHGCQDEQQGDAVTWYSGPHRVIIDHMSLSWTMDETVSLWAQGNGGISDVTVQWSLLAEALAGHSTNLITGGETQALAETVHDIDVHHSLLMNTSHRNPLVKTSKFRFVSNVVYNWGFYAYQQIGGVHADVVGNLFRKGPLSTGAIHEIQVGVAGNGTTPGGAPSLYVTGNVGFTKSDPGADDWPMVAEVAGENGKERGALAKTYRRAEPLPPLSFPIVVDRADGLEAALAAGVGASQRLGCDGGWVANRDAVDVRLLDEWRSGRGKIPSSSADVGGFPTLAAGTPCADQDHDGMPDAFETQQGLDAARASDGVQDLDGDGYTNVEEFLNGSDLRAFTP